MRLTMNQPFSVLPSNRGDEAGLAGATSGTNAERCGKSQPEKTASYQRLQHGR